VLFEKQTKKCETHPKAGNKNTQRFENFVPGTQSKMVVDKKPVLRFLIVHLNNLLFER
jgi:hypothetical protein